MAFRRDVLLFSLPFPRVSYICPHDYWLALIASAYFTVGLVSQPCMYYRRHTTNALWKNLVPAFYSYFTLSAYLCFVSYPVSIYRYQTQVRINLGELVFCRSFELLSNIMAQLKPSFFLIFS